MLKLVVIDTCNKCHHFDNSYEEFLQTCDLLDRKIDWDSENSMFHIPEDCPLKNYEGE